jgi:hypothetical protein
MRYVGAWPVEEGRLCPAKRHGNGRCRVFVIVGQDTCPYHHPDGMLPVGAREFFELSPQEASRVAEIAEGVREYMARAGLTA